MKIRCLEINKNHRSFAYFRLKTQTLSKGSVISMAKLAVFAFISWVTENREGLLVSPTQYNLRQSRGKARRKHAGMSLSNSALVRIFVLSSKQNRKVYRNFVIYTPKDFARRLSSRTFHSFT